VQGGWAQVQQHEQDRVQQEQGLQGDEGQGQQDYEASTCLEGPRRSGDTSCSKGTGIQWRLETCVARRLTLSAHPLSRRTYWGFVRSPGERIGASFALQENVLGLRSLSRRTYWGFVRSALIWKSACLLLCVTLSLWPMFIMISVKSHNF